MTGWTVRPRAVPDNLARAQVREAIEAASARAACAPPVANPPTLIGWRDGLLKLGRRADGWLADPWRGALACVILGAVVGLALAVGLPILGWR